MSIKRKITRNKHVKRMLDISLKERRERKQKIREIKRLVSKNGEKFKL